MSPPARRQLPSQTARYKPGGPGAERSFCGECSFLSDQKGTKESPGAGSEECKHSSRPPPDPVTGDVSRESFLESGAGGTADCFPFRAAAAGWAIQRRPGKLDEENAPGACSRRGWFWLGGRMVSAPTKTGETIKKWERPDGHSHSLYSERAQRRNEVSQEVLLLTFLSRKVRQPR